MHHFGSFGGEQRWLCQWQRWQWWWRCRGRLPNIEKLLVTMVVIQMTIVMMAMIMMAMAKIWWQWRWQWWEMMTMAKVWWHGTARLPNVAKPMQSRRAKGAAVRILKIQYHSRHSRLYHYCHFHVYHRPHSSLIILIYVFTILTCFTNM